MDKVLTHYEPISTSSAASYNWHMSPSMMGFWGDSGMMGGWQTAFWLWSILAWVTWILIIVALITLIRWFWKKGDQEKK